METADIIERYS